MFAQSFPRNAVTLALLAAARAAAAAVAGAKHLAQVMRHRRDAAILASFNDRMLADIGLTRGDVADAFAAPPWRDPTVTLADRVQERRTSRRGIWPGRLWLLQPSPSIVPPGDYRPVPPEPGRIRADAA